jgi:p-aminobenzoyl-glutamate transporter AbgT
MQDNSKSGNNNGSGIDTAVESGSKGILRWIEVMGNKLPHPFWMFCGYAFLLLL